MDERENYTAGGQPEQNLYTGTQQEDQNAQTSGQMQQENQTLQTGGQAGPGRGPVRRRRKNSLAGKAGLFVLGMAAGIAIILAVIRLFPMRIAATQYGRYEGETGSVLNPESMEKISVLEQIIREYYYEPETVKEDTMENGLFKGIMSSLGDPYTEYYTTEEYESLTEDTTGIYKGIGAYIGLENGSGSPVFTSIMPGTPAEEAGLQAGDIICEVDGVDTLTMSTSEVANLVKGEEGSQVKIKVSRDGEYITVTATRRTINVPTVDSKMLDDGIGYLAITQFDDVTPTQFDEAMADLKKQGMKSLIIDLRNNPGGTVTAVTQIASGLLPEGLVFYMEDKDGKREEYKCPGADFDIPLAVLVNQYSASASEILAGAIQDAKIGTIVGVTTFGKGIVQNVYPLADGSAVKITVADYYTRGGRNIHKRGIDPDVTIEYDEEQFEKDETDNQLEKAKEILLGKKQ